MKTIKKLFSIVLMAGTLFLSLLSCNKDEPLPVTKTLIRSGVYIIDYGNWGSSPSSISSYYPESDSIALNVFEDANGYAFTSNIQNVAQLDTLLYFASNNGDKIDIVSAKSMVAYVNPISENIEKPRYIEFNGNTAYVSCWSADADFSTMSTSYIAKIDLATRQVTRIALPGGPEGLAIANGKLYAALNYADSVAVMDLTDETFTYIATPAVSSYFLKDNLNNLYVSLVSTYSDFSEKTGLGYINTITDEITDTIFKAGISSNYGSIMVFNSDKSKIYVIAASYNASWELVGGIEVFNTTTKTFDESAFLSDITGINGISVDPTNDDVYCFVTNGTTPGTMKIYTPAGTLKATQTTGINPQMAVFVTE